MALDAQQKRTHAVEQRTHAVEREVASLINSKRRKANDKLEKQRIIAEFNSAGTPMTWDLWVAARAAARWELAASAHRSTKASDSSDGCSLRSTSSSEPQQQAAAVKAAAKPAAEEPAAKCTRTQREARSERKRRKESADADASEG